MGDYVEVEWGTEAPSGQPPRPRCAEEAWFSLHADVCINAEDRKRLERLCQYIATIAATQRGRARLARASAATTSTAESPKR